MTSYGTEDKHYSVQQNRVYTSITFLVRKAGPIHLELVGVMAGRQADEIWVESESFKILYRVNYWDCYFF